MTKELAFVKQNEPKDVKIGARYDQCVAIRSIEIKEPESPSKITMHLKKRDANGTRQQTLHLVDYIRFFFNQGNRNILETKDIPEFNDFSLYHEFSIWFTSSNNEDTIDIKVYYLLQDRIDIISKLL